MTTAARPRRKKATPAAQRLGCSGARCTEPAVQHVLHVARKGDAEVDLWLCEDHLERFRQGLYSRSSPMAVWLEKARGLLAS